MNNLLKFSNKWHLTALAGLCPDATVLRGGVKNLADQKTMGMQIAPAHAELEDDLQPGKRDVTRYLDPSPDQRIGEGQGYLQLVYRGRPDFGSGLPIFLLSGEIRFYNCSHRTRPLIEYIQERGLPDNLCVFSRIILSSA